MDFVAALGVTLDPWQWLVLRSSLLRNGDLWAAFTVAVCAPRQNGKNGILEVRELIGPLILGEKLMIHTAHLADTSKEAFRRLEDLIDANDWLSKQVTHIWRTNGHEAIEFKGRRRIRFRTRTRGGGRGFAGSPVIFDESMFLPEVSIGSALPVISAQPDPQVWYLGSAVDQESMDDGVTFARARERALSGESERLAYFEWSLDAANPEDVTEEMALSPDVWAQTNPAYGIRISSDYLAVEYHELGLRAFAVERLGVGDWPRTDRSSGVIDPKTWNELTDEESQAEDPLVLAFDVNPNRSRTSIAAVGMRSDELFHVEVVEHKTGTSWVADRLQELYSKHDPIAVVCDSIGPARSLIAEIEALGIPLTKTRTGEMAEACGFMFDAVEARTLRHLGQGELYGAIKGASKRPLGDAWAWSRRGSQADISPLVAVTLALWQAGRKLSSVYDARGMVAI